MDDACNFCYMDKILTILLFTCLISCAKAPTEELNRISELEKELNNKNANIVELQNLLAEQKRKQESSNQPEYWYAFEPTSEYNIAKLSEGELTQIDQIKLIDSVDIVYTFEHTTTISQLNDPKLDNFLTSFGQSKELLHSSKDYGPMADNLSFYVRTFIVCEEDGLPIETENCTDNIYILVQPTELGFKNNLFKISRLFRTEIKSLESTESGAVLTLEHSRYPRKELRVLIKPQLVKFLK